MATISDITQGSDTTQGKNKFILSALFAVLATPIFFATIAIALKIAIIASVAAVSYLLLSLIQKIRAWKNGISTQTEKQSNVSGDEGYDSADEEKDTVISVEEQKEIEVAKKELRNQREQKRMGKGLSDERINALGETIPDEITVGDAQSGNQNDKIPAEIVMESLPLHMDALGNKLPEQPSTNINMESKPDEELSLAELLSKRQQENNETYESRTKALLEKAAAKTTVTPLLQGTNNSNDSSIKTTTEEHIVPEQLSIETEPKPQGKLLSARELLLKWKEQDDNNAFQKRYENFIR